METSTIVYLSIMAALVLTAIFSVSKTFFTVQQNTVGAILRFGKLIGVRHTGLNIKIPYVDKCLRVNLQNTSAELSFQAITQDQANVYFKALAVYSPKDASIETIDRVAFKFTSNDQFVLSLSKTLEGMVRSFIAGKLQKEILTLRTEITIYVKEHILETLNDWGYVLHDLQINDITFDEVIMKSMAQVVASSNMKAAAENEGAALLIQKTKEAEAVGMAIKISANAEREAAKLRGEGVAEFRKAVTNGMKDSIEQLVSSHADDAVSLIAFSMWTEAIKHFAENGKGNIINLDGSPEGMKRAFMNTTVGNTNKNGKVHIN